MSDTVMLVIGLVGWAVVLGIVWAVGRQGDQRRDRDLERLRDWVTSQNIQHEKKVEAQIGEVVAMVGELERDLNTSVGCWEREMAEAGEEWRKNNAAQFEKVTDWCDAAIDIRELETMGQINKLTELMSDLNLRVARAEATIAATPTPPDPATIIAAATAPLLALTEQYTSPHQILAPSAPQPTAGDGEWSAEDLAAYDPTDEDFPPYRAPDDYSPPATFSGLGIDLPRLDG